MTDLDLGFRGLFDLLSDSQESLSVYQSILVPWVASHTAETSWLHYFASRGLEAVPLAENEDLWELYAVSRVNEVLLLSFQQGRADSSGRGEPKISLEEYLKFSFSLGFTKEEAPLFSPFYHEIVKVDQAENDSQTITLVETLWPCLMLGNMVFSRAGVRVIGGRKFIQKEIGEMSTLYWAYRRKNRPYQDLSHGWGHNSQWRTKFRRDYRFGRELNYNVDGKHELSMSEPIKSEPIKNDQDRLTVEERMELLMNRCFIRCTKPHNDLWPYEDRYRTNA